MKGGHFKTLAEALEKLTKDSPFFVKTMKLTEKGLHVHEDGSIEVTARVRLKWAGMSGLKGARGVNLRVFKNSRIREDDRELVFWDTYFLADYKIILTDEQYVKSLIG